MKLLRRSSHVRSLLPLLEKLRNKLNQCPELPLKEKRTSAILKQFIKSHGLLPKDVKESKTGFYVDVVGDLEKNKKSKNYLFRADMDATPDKDGISCKHLCGHDGHSAILAGALVLTSKYVCQFSGIRRFIFQPAEEKALGANLMIKGGVLKEMDAAIAIHNVPGLKIGQIGLKEKLFIPFSQTFTLQIIGKGGHGRPASEILNTPKAFANYLDYIHRIPKMVNSSIKDMATTVYDYSSAGEPVHPHIANLRFNFKFESPEIMCSAIRLLEQKISELKATGFKIKFKKYKINEGFFNDQALIRQFRQKLMDQKLPFIDFFDPANAAEDFGLYLKKIPGFMFVVGNGNSASLHNELYQFNNQAIGNGVCAFATWAITH